MTALLALLAGFVSGIAAVVLHQTWWLALVAPAVVGTLLWLRPGGARFAFAAGLSVPVLRSAVTTSEGDYLVPANAPGWGLLVGAFVVLTVAIATLRRPARAAADPEDRPSPT